MRWLCILLLLFVGCSTTITEIGPLLPKGERPVHFIHPDGKASLLRDYNKTLDSFLRYHFTDDAYYYLKDVPLVDAPCRTPYAAGVNVWSNLASLATLTGVGRKVVIRKEMLGRHGTDALKHEYVHHLDDLTRDGDASFIDVEEFKEAYLRLAQETHRVNTHDDWYISFMTHASKIKAVEKKANSWITNTFGVGPLSEHIAYASHMILGKKGVPDYFNRVYRKIFRKYEDLE